ncbi:rhomboid family intramembrane serine protease [Weissella confusa]|uniref:rhomboid family intramembrane serine protease n=1 Tax=Weissella confusa TaxID=1583 RepID=UPI0010930572|nr:rhomboid family intramembrane serine protease [Weissella confusa]MBJ7694191.1 rhomboid family intramembrane serine protease [Weissella confusa]QBZ04067.1 rhomboid family intramembrane serine protease [Weissella confusa]
MIAEFKRAFKATPATSALVAFMVVVYLWEAMLAQSFNISIRVLHETGAQLGPAILHHGEWWRLLTAGFLHVTASHLVFNMITLYFIGRLLELEIGHWRFLILFLATVISGNLMSLAFGTMNAISAGASGGVFGLLGAIVRLGMMDKRRAYWRSQAKLMTAFVLLSVISALFTPGIDLAAHIGGLVGGFLIVPVFISGFHYSGLFKIGVGRRLLALLVYLLLIAVLVGIATLRI